MKGLILKDLLSLYKIKVLILVIAIFGSALMIYFDLPVALFTFLSTFLAMQEISMVNPEKSCGWNLFQTALPISRKSAILEKYLMSLACGLVGFLVAALIYILCGAKFDDSCLINILICFCFLFSVTAVALPLAIWLPLPQFFLAMLGGFLIPALVILSWSVQITFDPVTMVLDQKIPFLAWCTVGCGILLLISLLTVPAWLSRTDQN